jgi:hypothetical protein
MRMYCKWALILGVVALAASPALAQGPGRGFGSGVGDLLRNEAVQKEIKLEGDKLTQVTDALKKVRDDNKEAFDKLRDRNTPSEERAEIRRKLEEATVAAVKDILDKDQMARIKQLQIQRRGYEAFSDPEVQKALKITDAQKDDIKKIAEDTRAEMGKLFQGGFNPQNFEKIAALGKEASEKIQKVLTDEQKKAYEELRGKAFEFPRPGPRPNQ